jgi:hypothetical protein
VVKKGLCYTSLAIALPPAPFSGGQQAAAAPIAAQIITAKKAFIPHGEGMESLLAEVNKLAGTPLSAKVDGPNQNLRQTS